MKRKLENGLEANLVEPADRKRTLKVVKILKYAYTVRHNNPITAEVHDGHWEKYHQVLKKDYSKSENYKEDLKAKDLAANLHLSYTGFCDALSDLEELFGKDMSPIMEYFSEVCPHYAKEHGYSYFSSKREYWFKSVGETNAIAIKDRESFTAKRLGFLDYCLKLLKNAK